LVVLLFVVIVVGSGCDVVCDADVVFEDARSRSCTRLRDALLSRAMIGMGVVLGDRWSGGTSELAVDWCLWMMMIAVQGFPLSVIVVGGGPLWVGVAVAVAPSEKGWRAGTGCDGCELLPAKEEGGRSGGCKLPCLQRHLPVWTWSVRRVKVWM
jgi:hypothetical protein